MDIERVRKLKLIILIGLSIIMFTIIQFISNYVIRRKKRRNLIQEEWRTKTFKLQYEEMESIAYYFETIRGNKQESSLLIDDITWNDLSMNEVFNQMNSTKSSVGSEFLFAQLHGIEQTTAELEANEVMYEKYTRNEELREEVALNLVSLGKENYSYSSDLFTGEFYNLRYIAIYIILAILPLASIPLMIFYSLSIGLLFLFCSFLTNAIVYYSNKNKLDVTLNVTSYVAKIIQCAIGLSEIKNQDFKEEKERLKQLVKPIKKMRYFDKVVTLGKGKGDLEGLLEYIRIIFLLDFISHYNSINIITKHQVNYREIWQTIGALDAAIAVVLYRHTKSDYCIPTYVSEEKISFKNMYHPLIDHPVLATTELNENALITGSNASGKSSFLKALAINSIFAQTIHTALAAEWTMKRGAVMTSMAISDDVVAGQSYFKAEVYSLKRIIDTIQRGVYCMSFIDEILKGTNTIERISASTATLKWLYGHSGLNITATHDIELTEILHNQVQNFHFKDVIIEEQQSTDYQLFTGATVTKNAIRLIESADYPQEITEQALSLAETYETTRNWTERDASITSN